MKIIGSALADCPKWFSKWTKVRHVPSGTKWYSKNDNLAGKERVGNPNNDTSEWSKIFDSEVPDFNAFLFASGDCTKWLVTMKEEAIGENYTKGMYLDCHSGQITYYK